LGDERDEPAVDAAAGGELVLASWAVVTVLVAVLVGGEMVVAAGGDWRAWLAIIAGAEGAIIRIGLMYVLYQASRLV
jgi:hypothetical protein